MSEDRIAYEELQPGDVIQEGDEWRNEDGRWQPFTSLTGSCVQVRHTQRARRPHSITMMLAAFASQAEVLANAQKAATQLQDEHGEALAEVAKLRMELWARKPLEDRVASLADELAQARAENQHFLKTIAENADQFSEHTAALVQERDEAREERDKLKGLIDDLLDEPTARQVQGMLRTWATELDWAADCFHSINRDEIDTIQRTLIAVMERIETMLNPEGDTDGN